MFSSTHTHTYAHVICNINNNKLNCFLEKYTYGEIYTW